jgi:hypothetical protein
LYNIKIYVIAGIYFLKKGRPFVFTVVGLKSILCYLEKAIGGIRDTNN